MFVTFNQNPLAEDFKIDNAQIAAKDLSYSKQVNIAEIQQKRKG